MHSPPIDELIARSVDGDKRAQRFLFGAYRHNITRLVWRILGPRPRAELEDAMQQVYIQVFRSLRHFRGEASFDTWVYRIGAKVCMQEISKKYRRRRTVIRTDCDTLEAVADDTFSPELSAERRETVRQLYGALARINPQRRTAFVLHEIEGKSIEEVAEIMGTSPGTVESRLFRSRPELAKRLRSYRGYKLGAALAPKDTTHAGRQADHTQLTNGIYLAP